MADDTETITKLPPVEDAGAGDIRLAPQAKPPPEKTPAQEAAEDVRDLMRQRVAELPGEEKRRAESERRQDEAAAKQAELNQRLREEQIRDLEENRQWRREHPRPVPPTISPPPQFHLTPPPGLFGESGTPQAQNAPGNQWMQALSVFGALGSGTDRRSAMTAMAAMTGMLKGWAQGQKEKFDEQYRAWKDASQTIVQNYERQSRYYDDVLSDNKLSFNEKQQEIALRAGEFKDTITQELAVQGRLDQADKLFETRAKAVKDLASAEKSVTDLKNKQEIGQLEDSPGIRLAAERALLGDMSYIRSYRAGSPARQAADNIVAQLAAERNISQDELTRREYAFGGGAAAARVGATAPIQVEATELKRVENLLTTLRPFEQFTKGQLTNLAVLASRQSRFGIPVADALMTRGRAALRDDPDAAAFLAQLGPTTNEIERIITTNAATNTLSVYAQRHGQELINSGYSARTIRDLAELFENDFARREYELITEANRHRAALGLSPEPLPEIPPLPPAGGRPTETPVNETRAGRGGKTYRKINAGPDNDRNNWEEVK